MTSDPKGRRRDGARLAGTGRRARAGATTRSRSVHVAELVEVSSERGSLHASEVANELSRGQPGRAVNNPGVRKRGETAGEYRSSSVGTSRTGSLAWFSPADAPRHRRDTGAP